MSAKIETVFAFIKSHPGSKSAEIAAGTGFPLRGLPSAMVRLLHLKRVTRKKVEDKMFPHIGVWAYRVK